MSAALSQVGDELDINRALVGRSAEARVRWALAHLPGRAVLSSSFGAPRSMVELASPR